MACILQKSPLESYFPLAAMLGCPHVSVLGFTLWSLASTESEVLIFSSSDSLQQSLMLHNRPTCWRNSTNSCNKVFIYHKDLCHSFFTPGESNGELMTQQPLATGACSESRSKRAFTPGRLPTTSQLLHEYTKYTTPQPKLQLLLFTKNIELCHKLFLLTT